MKMKVLIAVIALLLTGCGAEETFETVADEFAQPVLAEIRQIHVSLPEDAAVPVLESENGAVYACDAYEVYQQVLPAGDLGFTVREVSGYDLENLTLVNTRQGDCKRYDFVWAAAAEQGDRVGKGCILDDGSYHYVLTVLGNAETAGEYEAVWREILNSFSLS